MSRLSPATLLLGVVAVLFGLLGAYVIRRELSKAPAAAVAKAAAPQPITVPVASTDLEQGQRITLGDVAILKLTQAEINKMGLSKKSFMTNSRQLMGRVLKAPIKRGGTFDPTVFYPEGMGPDVAKRLQPGYRAVTINVEADAAMAGFTTAGSRVDILFRANEDRENDWPQTTVPLLENIEVLAFDRETLQGAKTDPRGVGAGRQVAITLAVLPEHASALRIVDGMGTLSLALRNPTDLLAFDSHGPTTIGDVLNRRGSRHKIEVYRGRSMQRVEFKRRDRLTDTPTGVANLKPTVNISAPANPPAVQPTEPNAVNAQ